MHAVINHVHLDMPVRHIASAVGAEGAALVAALPGFKGFYFIEEAEDRGAFVILWESAEAAVNGGRVLGPTWFHENIAPHLASEQVRSLGEVLVERLA